MKTLREQFEKAHPEYEKIDIKGAVYYLKYAEWLESRLSPVTDQIGEDVIRKVALEFFFYWWNTNGNNTEEAFDEWFPKFKSSHPELFTKREWISITREDAYNEGQKRCKGKRSIWKSKIFAAGAMWANMKLTGISDIIGNQPEFQPSKE